MCATQIERESLQRRLQLYSAAADVTWRLLHRQVRVGGKFLSRFVEPLGPAHYPAGHDQCLCLRSRLGESTCHQEFVEPHFLRSIHQKGTPWQPPSATKKMGAREKSRLKWGGRSFAMAQNCVPRGGRGRVDSPPIPSPEGRNLA